MKTVWKYEVPIDDQRHEVLIPEFAEIIGCGMQREMLIAFWAVVKNEEHLVPRYFRVVGTGHPIDEAEDVCGSVLDGQFVWHLVEMLFG
jgi:hypothetical protein